MEFNEETWMKERALTNAREWYDQQIQDIERLLEEAKRNKKRFEDEVSRNKERITADSVKMIGWAINSIQNYRPRLDNAPDIAAQLAVAANIKF